MRGDTLRQRMGWFHAWVGFAVGLVSVATFTCGALAVYDTELTRWMQPELSAQPQHPLSERGLQPALDEVSHLQADGAIPLLMLPSPRNPFLQVLRYDGTSFIGASFDPDTGARRSNRLTYGGTFFFIFHHALYLPKPWGSIPTEIAGLGLLALLVSGLVIHFKNLLPDFLLLRFHGPRLRSWTDAHILIGVFAFPFMMMMAYTGTATHISRLFPAKSSPSNAAAAAAHASSIPAHQASQIWAQLNKAKRTPGLEHIGFITFKGDATQFTCSDMANTEITRARITFSPLHPEGLVKRITPGDPNVKGWLAGFHFARWAPYPVRALYFLGGVVGSWMMSAGLIVFLMKRRGLHAYRLAFQVGETATLAVTTALPLAAIAYLMSSRLVPGNWFERCHQEVLTFFMVWLAAVLHAATRVAASKASCAWIEHLSALGLAGLSMPCVDIMTRAPIVSHAAPLYIITDGVALLMGVASLFGARVLARRCL